MSDGTYPDDLRYHPAHEWVHVDGDVATFGVTWHAQHALGDIVYYAPPTVGDAVAADASYGELESVKAVSDVIAPLSGEVVAVNDDVVSSPEAVNSDPYGAWLIKVRLADDADPSSLLDAAAYRDLIGA